VLSLVTLVRNRNELLRSFLAGMAHQTVPTEVVIVRAGGEEDPAEVVGAFPDVQARVEEIDAPDDRIPYSTARNTGAAAATGAHVAFLDADTIASPTFAASIGAALDEHDALCTGEVRYLPPGETSGVAFDVLRERARPHPHRDPVPRTGVVLGGRHELVWGLCMAMRHSTFERAGGFDEGYGGYAGEDTDLARRLADLAVPVGLVADAVVLHQHHDSFSPPVQQLRATVANAQRYRDKWGTWPMQGWLAAFVELGLLDWNQDSTTCHVRRDPTAEEVEACRRRVALPFERANGTTDNGICAVKVMWEDAPRLAATTGRELVDVLEALVEPAAILVTRRDRLGAAISQHRAEQTGEWSTADSGDRPAPGAPDLARVSELHERQHAGADGWRDLVRAAGRPWVEVVYEDVADEPTRIAAVAAELVGVDLPESVPLETALQVQRDGWNEQVRADWVRATGGCRRGCPGG